MRSGYIDIRHSTIEVNGFNSYVWSGLSATETWLADNLVMSNKKVTASFVSNRSDAFPVLNSCLSPTILCAERVG